MIKKTSKFIFFLSLLAIGMGLNLTNIQSFNGNPVELSLESLINIAEAQSEGGNDCWEIDYKYFPAWTETRIVNGQVVIIKHPPYYAEVRTWIC